MADPGRRLAKVPFGVYSRAVKRLALPAVLVVAIGLLGPSSAAGSGYRVRMFHTPGGNIGCAMLTGGSEGSVRCDIAHRRWKAPPKPRSCPLDYGNGLTVGNRGRAKFTCAGDTVLGQGKVLAVGRVARLGRFRCKSLRGAVRCVNRRTGHGFKLSRRVARRF